MKSSIKLDILDSIYNIYDEFIKNFKKSCKIGCSECCNCNVTITTLEGYRIFSYLQDNNKLRLIESFFEDQKRFKPKFTINQLTELYIKGEDISEEDNNPNWGKCPFLSNDRCKVYEVRPFMCRAQISEHDCKKVGYSLVNPFILTVDNIFLQYIEHIDFEGYFGNLTDILIIFLKKDNIIKYLNKSLVCKDPSIICNRRIKVLMIPPEDRIKVIPILNKLDRVIRIYI